ncbi:MAG: SDR family NAD(P)-dependent oxidoreductase [Bacteroidetes bacterium]|nr:SDR family NAD(P)-dependent oxidoreductase [Bacteroidota bacterium]
MKNILVTGASGNLGSALLKRFSQEGYKIVALDQKENGNHLTKVNFIKIDLQNEIEVADTVKQCHKDLGSIQVGCLLVGGFESGDLSQTTSAQLRRMIALNFETAYHVLKPLVQLMKTQSDGGQIFLIGARPALLAKVGKDYLAYSLSKSLLFTLADMINADGSNVRVKVIVPGTIDTPINRSYNPGGDFSEWVTLDEIGNILIKHLQPSELNADSVIKLYPPHFMPAPKKI